MPGISVTGSGIPASTTVSTVTPSPSQSLFALSANAITNGEIDTPAGKTGSLTFTNSEGQSFTAICQYSASVTTVKHRARYDSIPKEYSTKHFRFYREDSLGARRRTFLGTQNTETTTVDAKPPFEVFDINVNTIQVGSPDACD